jgi:hypothetical protein
MSGRLEQVTSRAATTDACDDCDDDGICDRHWLVHEVHRLREAIATHREKVRAHERAALEHKAEFPGQDTVHGYHQDLWAAIEGRDSID